MFYTNFKPIDFIGYFYVVEGFQLILPYQNKAVHHEGRFI